MQNQDKQSHKGSSSLRGPLRAKAHRGNSSKHSHNRNAANHYKGNNSPSIILCLLKGNSLCSNAKCNSRKGKHPHLANHNIVHRHRPVEV